MTPTEVRLILYRNGYHPVPLNGKVPTPNGWQTKYQTNAAELELWAQTWPNATNTGTLCRFTPCLDIDLLNEDAARDVEALVRERFEDGGYVLPRIGKWPKRAIPFRTLEPFRKISVPLIAANGDKSQKIELLADGQQFVVDGIHPDTGQPYAWPSKRLLDVPHEELPYIRNEGAQQLVDDIVDLLVHEHGYRVVGKRRNANGDSEPREPGEPRASVERIAAALAVIPNDDENWDSWNEIGMAAWRATAGSAEGFAAFDSWSRKSPKYDPYTTVEKWGAYFRSPPTEIGAGTIIRRANQASPDWELDYKLKQDPPPPEPPDPNLEPDPEGFEPDPEPEPSEPPLKPDPEPEPLRSEPRWRWIWEGEVLVKEARKWLVASLLPETGIALISGQWGAFKTFIALDLAVAVMTGGDFIKYPVMRPGGVLLLACEGQNEVAIRIRAAYEARGGEGKAPFAWQETSPRLLDPRASAELVAMIKEAAEEMQRKFGLPIALVIIDTAGKAAGYNKAGDENDAALAKIIMRTLSTVAMQTNTLVTAVAHFGKNVETGTRGSSAYEDDADVVLAALAEKNVAGSVTNTRLSARKRRSGPNGEEYPFRTKISDMGIDPAGIALNTLTIEWTDAPATPQSAKGKDGWAKKSLLLLRRALMNTLADAGMDIRPWADGPLIRAVDLEVVRPEFYKSYPAAEATDPKAKAAARQKAFKRAVVDATVNNLIGSWDVEGVTYVWLINPAPSSAQGELL